MRVIIALISILLVSCGAKSYDYIIIGGGASGTIASVEIAKKYPNNSVLLLERGISDTEYADTHSMTAWPDLLKDDNIKEGLRYKNGVWTILGKILSGGSAMNAGIMGQENPRFFTEAFGLNKEQNEKMDKVYQKLYNELGHKTQLDFLGSDLIAAAEELGLNNTGYQHSYVRKNSTFQTYSAFNMNVSTRNTTADYIRIHQARQEIPNLTVQVRSTVTRLIIGNDNLIAGVSVINNGNPEIYEVKKSVVLSAGAIKSTQLLQVSGIGDISELREAGIPPVINNTEVGKGFIDRILESRVQFSPINITLPLIPISSLSIEEGLLEERTAGGSVSSAFAIVTGVLYPPSLRTRANMKLFEEFIDHYPGLKTCLDNAVQINILVANPTSRGYIKALTPNIEDTPEVDPNFLATEEDKKSSKDAQAKAAQYFNTKALSKYARQQTGPSLECGLLIDFPVTMASDRASSLHLFGGATFGKVLNRNFTVNEIQNLFVSDASVFPRATEINPFNTISALGGFVAQEFVAPPSIEPSLPVRVQITNKEEPNKCLAIGSPIYAADCDNHGSDTLFWVQDVNTGRYVVDVQENTAYFLRSAQDDRSCVRHIIGGLTNQDWCNTNSNSQHVFFVRKEDGFFQVRFNMSADSGPCMLKWWGSNTVSGFNCGFVQQDRMKWKLKIIQ